MTTDPIKLHGPAAEIVFNPCTENAAWVERETQIGTVNCKRCADKYGGTFPAAVKIGKGRKVYSYHNDHHPHPTPPPATTTLLLLKEAAAHQRHIYFIDR